jgi:hypothetical protein
MSGRGCSPHTGEPRRFIIETTCPVHGFDAWPVLGEISMRLVILESPYAGDVPRNTGYARGAVRDCLGRGESPIASHLLFTQDGILDDAVPLERQVGIDAGLAWYAAAEAATFYMDHGLSRGMREALAFIGRRRPDLPTEFRFLAPAPSQAERLAYAHFPWESGFCARRSDHAVAEMPLGRLEAARHRRPPTPAHGFEARFAGRSVAFYASMEAAEVGAEHFYRFKAKAGAAFPWP